MLKVGKINIKDEQKVNFSSPEFYKNDTIVKFLRGDEEVARIEPYIPDLDVLYTDEDGIEETETFFAQEDSSMVELVEDFLGIKISSDEELMNFIDSQTILDRDVSDFLVIFDGEEYNLDAFISNYPEYVDANKTLNTLPEKIIATATILNKITE